MCKPATWTSGHATRSDPIKDVPESSPHTTVCFVTPEGLPSPRAGPLENPSTSTESVSLTVMSAFKRRSWQQSLRCVISTCMNADTVQSWWQVDLIEFYAHRSDDVRLNEIDLPP